MPPVFGLWKKPAVPVYLLLDRDSNVLAKGELKGGDAETNLQLKITEGVTDRVAQAELIQAIPPENRAAVLMCRVILRRGNNIVLEPLQKLGEEVRRNFRMPVVFESFLYPPSGGRYPVRSIDLSCGGVAFYSAAPLSVGDESEIVIPITLEGPLIVNCRVLRTALYQEPIRRFAAKFVGIIPDEEAALMEAVFSVELESIRVGGARKR